MPDRDVRISYILQHLTPRLPDIIADANGILRKKPKDTLSMSAGLVP